MNKIKLAVRKLNNIALVMSEEKENTNFPPIDARERIQKPPSLGKTLVDYYGIETKSTNT